MPNPRILLFGHTGAVIGGMETWLDGICRHLSGRGFDPVVGLVRGMHSQSPDRYRQFHPELQTVDIDGRGLNREGRIRTLVRTIRRVQPQIVVPMGVVDGNDAAVRAKSRLGDLRLLSRVQGNVSPLLADVARYQPNIDRAVCPGALTRDFLVQVLGFDPDRVDHIPNGSDLPQRPHVPRRADEPLRLGYLGRFSQPDKRILDLPLLCQVLTKRQVPFHLTVAGDGVCREQLYRELQPFQPSLQILGPLTRERLYAEVYPRLDCLLLFSSSEGFCNAVLEAMMHGVVPVTSEYLGFQSERLAGGWTHCRSFPVGNIPAAADAIQKLDACPELWQTLSAAARNMATEKYTWQQCLGRWQDALEKTLSRSPLPPDERGLRPFSPSGRLDRLGVPPAVVDMLRRVQRRLVGVPGQGNLEEWPMFGEDYDPARLEWLAGECAELERAAAVRYRQLSGSHGTASVGG